MSVLLPHFQITVTQHSKGQSAVAGGIPLCLPGSSWQSTGWLRLQSCGRRSSTMPIHKRCMKLTGKQTADSEGQCGPDYEPGQGKRKGERSSDRPWLRSATETAGCGGCMPLRPAAFILQRLRPGGRTANQVFYRLGLGERVPLLSALHKRPAPQPGPAAGNRPEKTGAGNGAESVLS